MSIQNTHWKKSKPQKNLVDRRLDYQAKEILKLKNHIDVLYEALDMNKEYQEIIKGNEPTLAFSCRKGYNGNIK